MYDDIMTVGDAGSFIAFVILAVVVIGGIAWLKKKK